MLKNKRNIIILVVIAFIVLISFIVYIVMRNEYSRENLIDLVKKSNLPNNIYIENNIYENNTYLGLAKFYIKDNTEYIYQENNNQEKIEIYINNEDNTSTIILHEEKIITQNNIQDNSNFELPLKDGLLDKLNNTKEYQYTYYGIEIVNEINCIKISLMNNENNSNCNYYIDENTGYIVQYENNNTGYKETYTYNINSVTDEQLKLFNVDNYSDYTFINSI